MLEESFEFCSSLIFGPLFVLLCCWHTNSHSSLPPAPRRRPSPASPLYIVYSRSIYDPCSKFSTLKIMSGSPSKYSTAASRRSSFVQSGVHFVETDIEAGSSYNVNRKPLLQASRHLLQQSGFLHSHPLFLQTKRTKRLANSSSCSSHSSPSPSPSPSPSSPSPTYEYDLHDLSASTVLTIGTSPSNLCHIQDDAGGTVGERHAKIFNQSGCTYIQDLGTEHGTHLILGRGGGRDEYGLVAGDHFIVSDTVSVEVSEVHREHRTCWYKQVRKANAEYQVKSRRFSTSRERRSSTASAAATVKAVEAEANRETGAHAKEKPADVETEKTSPKSILKASRVQRSNEKRIPPRVKFHEHTTLICFAQDGEVDTAAADNDDNGDGSDDEIFVVHAKDLGLFTTHGVEQTGDIERRVEIERSSSLFHQHENKDEQMKVIPAKQRRRTKSGRHFDLPLDMPDNEKPLGTTPDHTVSLELKPKAPTTETSVVGALIPIDTESCQTAAIDTDVTTEVFTLDGIRSESDRELHDRAQHKKMNDEKLKKITSITVTKIIVTIIRQEGENKEKQEKKTMEMTADSPPLMFGTASTCNVIVPQEDGDAILPEHCQILFRHGTFQLVLTTSKIIDDASDDANVSDLAANKRALKAAKQRLEREKRLRDVLIRISSSSHGGAQHVSSSFSQIEVYDRLLLGGMEVALIPPPLNNHTQQWNRAALQLTVGGWSGGGTTGIGEDTMESLQEKKQEERLYIIGGEKDQESIIVGRKSQTCDLVVDHLDRREVIQVGGEHLRVYKRRNRYYAQTLKAGKSSGTFLLLGRGMVGGNQSHVLTPGDTFRIGISQFKVIAFKAKGRGVQYGDRRSRKTIGGEDVTEEVLETSFKSHFQVEQAASSPIKVNKETMSSTDQSTNDKSILSEQERKWGEKPMENTEFVFLPHFLILQAMTGPRNGRLFPMSESRITMGASKDATITMNDRNLEGFHCFLELGMDGLYRINDLETDSGTFLRVDDVDGDIRLELGDVLSLGIGCTELVVWGEVQPPQHGMVGQSSSGGCCSVS